MTIEHFGLFVLATFLLNITPGNDFIYVATRTLGYGTRAGIISALGISAGLVIHVTASVLGLSVILSQSALAFSLIKYTGAAYLVYLGVKMILSGSGNIPGTAGENREFISSFTLFRQGFLTNVFNPKVALFFLSFLPQFADSNSANFSLQLLLLGLWFIFSGTLVSMGIAFLFGKLRNVLASFTAFWEWQQKITGFILIGLGLKIAMEKS